MPFCFGENNTCSDRRIETATNTIRLDCHIEANPQAEVYWLYLGKNETNTPTELNKLDFRMSDFRNGTLEIKNLRRNDTGYYQCYANNSLGNDKATMHLYVKGKEVVRSNKRLHERRTRKERQNHQQTDWKAVEQYFTLVLFVNPLITRVKP